MMKGSVGILGTGAYLPEGLLTNEELARRFEVTPEWIFQRTGISRRHIVSPGQNCADLAIEAARQALKNAAVAPEEIDAVILSSSSIASIGGGLAPGLQQAIGTSRAVCFDLTAACSGFVFGLVMSCHAILSGLFKKVLVIGSEVMSDVLDPHDLKTAILFGDGAGAVVLGAVPEGYGLLASDLGTDGSGFDCARIDMIGNVNNCAGLAQEMPSDRLPNVVMDGQAVFAFAMRVLGESALRLLDKAGLTMEDLDFLIPHQANQRIVQAAVNLLDLPEEKIIENIENIGNTSTASIPIALHEAIEEGRIGHDSLIAMVGFGAGLSWGSCLLRLYLDQGRNQGRNQ